MAVVVVGVFVVVDAVVVVDAGLEVVPVPSLPWKDGSRGLYHCLREYHIRLTLFGISREGGGGWKL